MKPLKGNFSDQILTATKPVLVFLLYFAVAKIGLQLASIHPSASPIWPATGVAIGVVLLWGYGMAPAIFVAAFLVNQLTAGSLFTSIAIAVGNSLEAVAAVYLTRRYAGGSEVFESPAGVLKFVLIAIAATAISASVGPIALATGGHVPSGDFLHVAFTWWLGDLAGGLVVTPVVALWGQRGTSSLDTPKLATAAAYVGAAIVGLISFSPLVPEVPIRDMLVFLAVLPLLWAGLRLGPRHTATISLVLSAFAVWGTMRDGGPFATGALNKSFLLLIMFVISAAVPSLALATEVAVRNRTEAQRRQRALEAEVLWQASALVAAGGSFRDLLQACLERICRVTGWAAGHVFLPDNVDRPTVLVPSSVWYFQDDFLEPLAQETKTMKLGFGEGLPGRIWSSGMPVWEANIAESTNLPRKAILLKYGLNAAFGFPLMVENRLQAILEFFSTSKQAPDEHLMRVVQSLGEQLGRVLERQCATEQQKVLMRELTHRVGNTLAVLQSMFHRSIQHARSMEDLEKSFTARLHNLAGVHRQLSEANWHSAKLTELLKVALRPYCAPDYEDCKMSGPEVEVPASMALSLAMIFHELASNASKHGALSDSRGTVRVIWELQNSSSPELHIVWEETGSSAEVRFDHAGYGSALLQSTTRALKGSLRRNSKNGGLSIELTIPIL